MKTTNLQDAILRIGEVSGIEGRKIVVKVDKNKNASDLIFDGKIIKNISVGNYIEIKKGFLSIIGKTDGEYIDDNRLGKTEYDIIQNNRYLKISLVGYINDKGNFIGGIKEMPLLGNEAFILPDKKIQEIHNFSSKSTDLLISIAKTDSEEIPIKLPIDGIFNSHIAIFGNTGSGKSNTLASLYQSLFLRCNEFDKFRENCKFAFFDFNGEYCGLECLTKEKIVYSLSTNKETGDKIPLSYQDFFDLETLSILIEATEKTQKPFVRRTLYKYLRWKKNGSDFNQIKDNLHKEIINTLKLSLKELTDRLLDYLQDVFELLVDFETTETLREDIRYHGGNRTYYLENENGIRYFNGDPDAITSTNMYKVVDTIGSNCFTRLSPLSQFYIFLILQLIDDLQKYKIQNEHIYPVINRMKSRQSSIEKIVSIEEEPDVWKQKNCIVFDLLDISIEMKKMIPLMIVKNLYHAHKKERNQKSLNIIVDEAHNILSSSSARETEEWKDYRLETFEEIIKEGRKYGVFLTIASQRPNDISETIISQAHNYFIHQLVNERDLRTIGNAISYIDKLTEESIPTLSVGTCIFSGVATPMPIKIKIDELAEIKKPKSHTLKFSDLLK